MDSNGSDETRPEVDREEYAPYHAYMEQKFAESPYIAEYRAKFQARKDAKLARERAGQKAISKEKQPSPSVALDHDAAAGANPLQAWKPRKHPLNQNSAHELSTNPKLPVPNPPEVSRHTNDPALTARRPSNTGLGSPKLSQANTRVSSNDESTTTCNTTPSSRKSSSASETLPTRPKRPVDPSIHEDARPSISKKPRRSSSISQSETSDQLMVRRTGINRHPPQWYKELPKPNNTRDANKSDEETMLFRIKEAIRTAKASNGPNRGVVLPTQFGKIISMVHKIVFLNVTDKLLRKTRMLDNNDGLPQLFDDEFSGGIPWPWYLRADAEELYNKWCGKVFETDLYRGLIRAMGGKGKGNSSSDTLGEDSKRYRLVNPKQHGNGLLINGTWWPTQLAVLRDGGHGSSQGGIASDIVEGAFSVIMAGGLDPNNKPYPNIDRGDEVLYCGTDNVSADLNEPSRETKALIVNRKNGQPVRLFRSSNLGSKFAPEQGFRYDGLYSVAGFEILDPPQEKRKRHLFRLLRCEGQDPIRSEGPEKRPTKEEIYEYEKDKKNRGR